MQAEQPVQPDPLSTQVHADGARLDRAVADWRGLSRAAVGRLLERGAVRLNGRVMGRTNKGDLLRAGDRLELAPGYADGEVPVADKDLTLEVLLQGRGYLVLNKPAGVPVRPHALDEMGTVLNAVVANVPEVVGVGEGGLRSGIVHRLDNDTSGALLIATQQDAWDRFRAAFAEHRIEKRYLALVHGVPEEVGTVVRDLIVTTHRPARVLVQREGTGGSDARRCSLSWTICERIGTQASLIEVDLHTGFLHQVRAMMSDLGHPVLGDAVYGIEQQALAVPRQMLHAKSLAFEDVSVEAPIPEDMRRVLDCLRG